MTSPALRPYQATDAAAITALIARRVRSILYVLPTRGGKTVTVASVLRRLVGLGWQITFNVHRQELRRQASKALARLDIPHGVIEPGSEWTSHPVHVCSIDTVKARLGEPSTRQRLATIDLGVFDEGHHSEADGWAAVIAAHIMAQILGMTATPYRLDGKGLSGTFQHVVRGPSIRELIAMGYLVQPETFAPMTMSLAGIRKVGGDFNRKQLAALLKTEEMTRLAVTSYARFAPGVPAVFFCVDVEHTRMIADAMCRAGWRAASVDGSMSDIERERAIYGLADRSVQVLTSCEIISEGTDLPYVGLAGKWRPTASTSLDMQQGGRVLTPHLDKTNCRIIDPVGNWARHGLVDQDRTWSLDGGVTGLERQVNALRRCGNCHRVVEQGPTHCPTCGRKYPTLVGGRTAAQVAQLPGVAGVDAPTIAAMPWDEFERFLWSLNKRAEVAAVARIRNYDRSWVDTVLRKIA